MIGRRTPSPIRVWRSWYRATFGSAVAVSGTEQGETPESLVTPAFVGFPPVVENGIKAVLTTGLTTDRKIFDFLPRRGIMIEIEYPGVVQLIERVVWDHEAESLSLSTRTKIPLKSLISEGFSYSLSIAAQTLSLSFSTYLFDKCRLNIVIFAELQYNLVINNPL